MRTAQRPAFGRRGFVKGAAALGAAVTGVGGLAQPTARTAEASHHPAATMYRVAWSQGQTTEANWKAGLIAGTRIHVIDNYLPYFGQGEQSGGGEQWHHTRCHWATESATTWYNKYRGNVLLNPARCRGIGIDEFDSNHMVMPDVVAKMRAVDNLCDGIGTTNPPIRRPDWLIAIAPGQPAAIRACVDGVLNYWDGTQYRWRERTWWFAQTYIGIYKGAGDDLGRISGRLLLDEFTRPDRWLHHKTIYAYNVSQLWPVPTSAPGTNPGPRPNPYNIYDSDVRDQNITNKMIAFAHDEVRARGVPFGFGVWTPVYSTVHTRADASAAFSNAGCTGY